MVGRTLRKQPGDTLQFTVMQAGELLQMKVTLGGGTTVSPSQLDRQRLAIEAVRRGDNQFEIKRPSQQMADAAADPPLREGDLLRRQLAAFELVIQRLQAEVQQRDEREKATLKHIETLQAEVEQLRKRLESATPSP